MKLYKFFQLIGTALRILVLLIGFLPLQNAQASLRIALSQEEAEWIKDHPVITYAIDPLWQPIEFSVNGQAFGLSTDYLNNISNATGLKFKFKPTSSRRESIREFDAGQVDMLSGAYDDLMQLRFTSPLYSRPYYSGSSLIVAASGTSVIYDAAQLAGMTVAVGENSRYEQWLRSHYPKIQLNSTTDEAGAVAAVAAGKVQVAIVTDVIAFPLLQGMYAQRLHIAGTLPDVPAVIKMAVNPDMPLLLSIINKSLARMSADETERLNKKWFIQADGVARPFAVILQHYRIELFLGLLATIGLLLALYQARRTKRDAVKSEQDKSAFLAMMSQEIRAPMNAVLGAIELVRRNTPPLPGQSLLRLLDDVLDYSRLQARRLPLDIEPVNPLRLAKETVELLNRGAIEKGLQLQLVSPQENLPLLMLDPRRTRQILLNLLSNAIRFTQRGSITLSLNVSSDNTARLFSMTVKDTGAGIPAAKQRQLFEAFTQSGASIARRLGGPSLGLIICRKLIELMQGTIELENIEGCGSAVTIKVPVTIYTGLPDIPEDAQEPSSADLDAKHTGTILVVEDHPSNQLVIKQQLDRLRFACDIVDNGLAALQNFKSKTYLAILLDCHLPGMNGYETAAALREIEQKTGRAYTPILAISAFSDAKHVEGCLRSGMDAVLEKPLRLNRLRETLRLWLGVTVFTDEPKDGTAALTPESQANFYEATQADLKELRDAMACRNTDQIRYWSHRIFGAAKIFHYDDLASHAEHMETALAESPKKYDFKQLEDFLTRMENALTCQERTESYSCHSIVTTRSTGCPPLRGGTDSGM